MSHKEREAHHVAIVQAHAEKRPREDTAMRWPWARQGERPHQTPPRGLDLEFDNIDAISFFFFNVEKNVLKTIFT